MANPMEEPTPERRRVNAARNRPQRQRTNVSSFHEPLRHPQSTPLFPNPANLTHNIEIGDRAGVILPNAPTTDQIYRRSPFNNGQSDFSPIVSVTVTEESSGSPNMTVNSSYTDNDLAFTPRGPPSTRVPDFILNSRPPVSSVVNANIQNSMEAAFQRVETLGRDYLDPDLSDHSIINLPKTSNTRVRFANRYLESSNAQHSIYSNNFTKESIGNLSRTLPMSYGEDVNPYIFQSDFARNLMTPNQGAPADGELPRTSSNLREGILVTNTSVSKNVSASVPSPARGADVFSKFRFGSVSAPVENNRVSTNCNVTFPGAVTSSTGDLKFNFGSVSFDQVRNMSTIPANEVSSTGSGGVSWLPDGWTGGVPNIDFSNSKVGRHESAGNTNNLTSVSTASNNMFTSIGNMTSNLTSFSASNVASTSYGGLRGFTTGTSIGGVTFSNPTGRVTSSVLGFNNFPASLASSSLSYTTNVTSSGNFGISTPSLGVNNLDVSKPPPSWTQNNVGTIPKVSQEKFNSNGNTGLYVPPSVPTHSFPNTHSTFSQSGLPVLQPQSVAGASAQSGIPPTSGLPLQSDMFAPYRMPVPSGGYNYPYGFSGNQFLNGPNNTNFAGVPNSNNPPFDMEFLIKEITARLQQSQVNNTVSNTAFCDNRDTASANYHKSKHKPKHKRNSPNKKVRITEELSSSEGDSSSSSEAASSFQGFNPMFSNKRKNNSKSNGNARTEDFDAGGVSVNSGMSYGSRYRHREQHFSRSNTLNLTEAERTILYKNGVTDADMESRAIQISANECQFVNAQTPQIVYAAPHDNVDIFSGNMEDFELWKSDLMAYMVTVPEFNRFRTLHSKLPTGLQNKIAMYTGNSQKAFDLALKALSQMFDNPTAVVQILTDQINAQLDHVCARDEVKFSNMVAGLRNKFNRILKISPFAICNLNAFLTKFMECLPRDVRNKAVKIRHKRPEQFCFKKLLEMAEEHNEISWSHRYGAESRNFVPYNQNRAPSHDRYNRHPSRGNSYDRSGQDRYNRQSSRESSYDRSRNNRFSKNNSHHINSNQTNSDYDETPIENVLVISGSESSTSNHMNKSKFRQVSPRGRSPAKKSVSDQNASRTRSKSNNRFRCLLCLGNEHSTIDCPEEKSTKELNDLVREHRICTYCGNGGHLNTACYRVRDRFKADHTCSNPSNKCKDIPHSKRFCSIYQRD